MDKPRLLENSQEYCRRIVRNSGSSFRTSFSFLKPDAQQSMHTLYAFARVIDDVADEPHHANRLHYRIGNELHNWLDKVASVECTDDSTINTMISEFVDSSELSTLRSSGLLGQLIQITPAVSELCQRYLVTSQLHAIMDGTEFDLNPASSIQDDEYLYRYCDWVASSVGLACLHIWGANVSANAQAAEDCGRAFQLTNILRDVAEDAERGRIYLPLVALEEYGCTPSNWLARNPDGDWMQLMRRYIAQASEHYAASYRLINDLPFDAGRMFSLMWNAYRKLLSEIEMNLVRVWQSRIRLTYTQKMTLYLEHAFTPLYVSRIST